MLNAKESMILTIMTMAIMLVSHIAIPTSPESACITDCESIYIQYGEMASSVLENDVIGEMPMEAHCDGLSLKAISRNESPYGKYSATRHSMVTGQGD